MSRVLASETLLEYRDHAGRRRRVGSIRCKPVSRQPRRTGVTAKDFRTWWGTVSAFAQLREPAAPSQSADAEEDPGHARRRRAAAWQHARRLRESATCTPR